MKAIGALVAAASMRRAGIIAAGAVVFVAVASQLLLPTLGERGVEDRLTESGGSAEVTLGAFPAARLLFDDGERLEVAASELDLDLDRETEVFDRLDGFSLVDLSIDDSRAGPFELETFELTRDGDGPYRLVSIGTTSASALAEYGLDRFELPGESVAGFILDRLFGDSDVAVPLDLDMELTSDDGRVQVVSGGGTVGGIDAGPLAQMITSAIVVQL